MTLFRSDAGWRVFTRQQLEDLGIWPNKLWHNARTGEAVLVAHQSEKYPEFALSEAGPNYLLAALEEGRIKTGDVALVNLDGEQIARKSVGEVAALLKNRPPRKGGPFGPFHLFNSDLTPYDANKVPF